ncbi:MAG: Xylose import ATP-binding protein XylG [Candidatus Erwinia impunctatus]|nr:Xylose import ATP-binding protein XylG [Culicoides impunctatus]
MLAQVKLDVDPTTRVGELGLGQQQLVEIAKALNKQVRLLVLDEPTASLTESETATLLEIIDDLRHHGIACIYISHKLNEVKAISDFICVIRDGQHIGTRAAAGMSEEDIIAMMVGRELTELYPQAAHTVGEVILQVEHLTAWHPINRHIRRVDYVSFTLRRGEILGIAGLVGSGRSETMQCLFGAYAGRWEGTIMIDGQRVQITDCRQAMQQGIAMVPEDRKRDGIVPIMGVGANMTLAALDDFSGVLTVLDDAREQLTIQQSLARLRVKTSSPDLAIGRLSGGNQQKEILAKCLLLNPRILILDEPTRGIDIGAKQEIYKLINQLVQQGIAVIVVSSELPEVLGLSDRVVVMHQGKIKASLVNRSLTQEQVMEAALRSETDVEKYAI